MRTDSQWPHLGGGVAWHGRAGAVVRERVSPGGHIGRSYSRGSPVVFWRLAAPWLELGARSPGGRQAGPARRLPWPYGVGEWLAVPHGTWALSWHVALGAPPAPPASSTLVSMWYRATGCARRCAKRHAAVTTQRRASDAHLCRTLRQKNWPRGGGGAGSRSMVCLVCPLCPSCCIAHGVYPAPSPVGASNRRVRTWAKFAR
jgi:hypothetical protein